MLNNHWKIRRFCVFVLPIVLMSCFVKDKGNVVDIYSVKTEAGFVSGREIKQKKVSVFLGVPYAAPPLGNLRWKAPQPAEKWEGVRSCVTPPPSAMQATPAPYECWSREFQAPVEPISEDCLYLNIWTPAKTTVDKLPVIVWIHGGAFINGSGTVPLYNGENIAQKGVVFVTINYRLGVLGFLAHPELTAESDLQTSGNYGLLDQIEALKWIKNNIEAFGGDWQNVTIAGQSAGAFSVNALVVSPLSKGLFHKVIAQSGGMFNREIGTEQTLAGAEQNGLRFAKGASIAHLRSLPADSLISIPGRFRPVTDKVVLPNVLDAFESGNFADVPTLTGWNADDGASFGTPPSASAFMQNAQKVYGDNAAKYLELFPANTDAEAAQSHKMLSQLQFGLQNYRWAQSQTQFGDNNAYLYFFTRVPPGEPYYGAFHSAEFAYALHTLTYWDRPFVDVDFRLQEMMSSYWTNFAKTGNPNADNLPQWPVYDVQNPAVINLGDSVYAMPLPYKNHLLFLDKSSNHSL